MTERFGTNGALFSVVHSVFRSGNLKTEHALTVSNCVLKQVTENKIKIKDLWCF